VTRQSNHPGVVQPTRATSSLGYSTANTRLCSLPFQFKPLQDGHIRLLDLHDAIIHNDILVGFKLVTVPLCSAPTYEALSYCWGSTDLCTGIVISAGRNRQSVYRVTEHLATFLHNILVVQRPAEDRLGYVWMDQICINQDDVAERNAQVRRMADIYKSATRVIVWLGQNSAFNEETLDITINADLHMKWRGKPFLDWLRIWAVFGRPWFFRQWVFQEAVFAQHLWFMLDTGLETLSALLDLGRLLDDFSDEERAQKFAHKYNFAADLNRNLLYWIEDYARGINSDYEELMELLCGLSDLECQDQRDKVFSLIGFAGDMLPADFVDYDCPAASIFQKLTRHLVLETGSLTVITFIYSDSMKRRPSWVPFWKEDVNHGLSSNLENQAASLDRKWRPSLMVVENELNVSGRVIDLIAAEVPSFPPNAGQYLINKHIASVLRRPYHEACALIGHIQKIELTGNTSSEEQWDLTPEPVTGSPPGILRSSFSHFFNTIFISKEEIESDFSTLIQGSNDEQALARLVGLMEISLHVNCMLLVLGSGRLGLVKDADGDPQVGDAIAILHGLDVPCILRKSEDDKGWLFVKEIYIHDIMHGEGKFDSYSCLRLH
jgi:hypothetical protein